MDTCLNKEDILQKALAIKDKESLRIFLDNDTNKQTAYDCLLEAIKSKDEETAIFLVECGVPPSDDDPEVFRNESPLHLACKSALVDFIKSVPNIELYLDYTKRYEEWQRTYLTPFQSALMEYRRIVRAPWFGGLERHSTLEHTLTEAPPEMTSLLIFLLEKGADANSLCCFRGEARSVPFPLQLACSTPCNQKLAKVLLKCGAAVNAESSHFTPLLTALKSNYPKGKLDEYLELIEDLLKAGSDTTRIIPDKRNGIPEDKNAISYAMSCNFRVMDMLIKYGANINQLDSQGNPIIYERLANNCFMSRTRKVECINYLFQHPPKVDLNLKSSSGENIFHILCCGAVDVPGMIWEAIRQQPELKVYLNTPDNNMTFPLFHAVDHFNLRMALAYIQCGAIVNVFDGTGKTVFDKVVERYCFECADYLACSWVCKGISSALRKLKKPIHLRMNDTTNYNKLVSFCEAILNRGILSEVYLTSGQGSQQFEPIWKNMHLKFGGYSFAKFVNFLQSADLQVPVSDDCTCAENILRFVQSLGSADVFLCLHDYKDLEKALQLFSWSKDSYHDKVYTILQKVVASMKGEVVQLKRLCRKCVRVYTSTAYGKSMISFDLRKLSRMLPVPRSLQEYIRVKLE